MTDTQGKDYKRGLKIARQEEEKTLKSLHRKRRTIIQNRWELYQDRDLADIEERIFMSEKRLGFWKDSVD